MDILDPLLIGAFVGCQLLYALAFLVDFYLVTRPVNWVDMRDAEGLPHDRLPNIVLLYPVLRELEATMRTTFHALARMDYPRDRFVVIAIPNANDDFTLASLHRLQNEFPFLQIMPVPATSDPSWQVVWDAWERNPKAYWWHQGRRAGEKALPPKKTRQLIYAFYHLAQGVKGDWLLTVAIDTAKRRGQEDRELYEAIDPNAYYTLYGDRSVQAHDAESRYPVYMKLEKNTAQILFGDFNTDLNDSELARYSRNLSGLKASQDGETFSATVFAAETNQGFVKDEIRADGTSGPYQLSQRDIVRNQPVSRSKSYWKPERPPPFTATRSMEPGASFARIAAMRLAARSETVTGRAVSTVMI